MCSFDVTGSEKTLLVTLYEGPASILLDIGLLILTFNVMNVRQTSAKAPRAIDLVDART